MGRAGDNELALLLGLIVFGKQGLAPLSLYPRAYICLVMWPNTYTVSPYIPGNCLVDRWCSDIHYTKISPAALTNYQRKVK